MLNKYIKNYMIYYNDLTKINNIYFFDKYIFCVLNI